MSHCWWVLPENSLAFATVATITTPCQDVVLLGWLLKQRPLQLLPWPAGPLHTVGITKLVSAQCHSWEGNWLGPCLQRANEQHQSNKENAHAFYPTSGISFP